MIKYVLSFLLIAHGVIHLLGFVKAYGLATVSAINSNLSKGAGLLWLLTALLLMVTAILFFTGMERWWITAIIAVLLSQLLIFSVWKEAKFGTMGNVIILIAALLSMGSQLFENGFKRDVQETLQLSAAASTETMTEADLQNLPDPVQRYLKYAGVLHQPKVRNARIVFDGEMRGKGKEYFPFTSVQYNFFDDPARLFFMQATMSGLLVYGYHRYAAGTATMTIKLFGIYPVLYQKGDTMNMAETVTLFNDMCLLAPATLIDKRISWTTLDKNIVRGTFTNGKITVSAVLYFQEDGQLVNFISGDRTDVSVMKQYPWSTPVSNYKLMNGINVMTYGEAIWHYPESPFTYGKFHLRSIAYNVAE